MRVSSISGVALALVTAGEVLAAGKANTFAIVGHTGVSAQQLFLGNEKKVYIVDKVEANPIDVAGHPSWAVEYDIETHELRALDIITNSFCAGGNVLGNGSWLNVGGNNAVTTGGVSVTTVNITEGGGAYEDLSGGKAARVLTPCLNSTCAWHDDPDFLDEAERWYPTLEAVEDGSNLIIGGELWGGFVNSVEQKQNTPTYEFFPTRGDPITMRFLEDTQPANLYPLTWLLPNGLLFVQADWQTTLLDYHKNRETRLPNITHAQRTYPSNGAVAMLPLTAASNYEPTILFCGGMKPERDDWNQTLWKVIETPTLNSCVSIDPMDGKKAKWVDEEDLPEGRGMGNAIILPDDRLFLVNGVGHGSAGYGWDKWAVGQSYATDPVRRPAYYNHTAPKGSRWFSDLPSSTIDRMYHSVATLLPDGSVFIAGSNPNADVITEENNATYPYKTEYRSEIWYPDYFDSARPQVTGIPSFISYGGDAFDLEVSGVTLGAAELGSIQIRLIRTGFSTHAVNFGMKSMELAYTYTTSASGVTLHVAQAPPNAALFQPGPALLFVTVAGVPSLGKFVMVGSGNIEEQTMLAETVLPPSDASTAVTAVTKEGTSTSSKVTSESSATSLGLSSFAVGIVGVAAALLM